MGGTVPIQNATVHLFTVGTSGYGSTPSQLSGTTTLADGTFSFGLFTCSPADSIVYISAVHGTSTGSGTNSSLSMLAMLGPCNQIANPTDITVNEVTTAASTYAMSQFMGITAPSQIGSPFTKTVGLTNSSLVVKNLVDFNAGTAPGPALPSGATAPTSELNTLANIIAPCVTSLDSGGNPSAACQQLFCVATPGGTFSGTCSVTPTINDTLKAMFSIARNPASNIAALFALATANSPFSPSLPSASNDWTIALNYVGGGLNSPFFIALDGLGDPWISNFEGDSVTKLSPTGVALSGSGGFTAGGIDNPEGIAVDSSNDAWIGNENGTLTQLDVNGNALSGMSGYSGGGLGQSYALAIDPQQNVWASDVGNSIAKICGSIPANCPMGVTTGQPISPGAGFSGGGLDHGLGLSTDASSNAWVASSGPTSGSASQVCEFDPSGNPLSGMSGYTGGGLLSPTTYTTIDTVGHAWTTNIGNASVTEMNSSGVPISGSSGFTGGGISDSESLASDGANNIWISNELAPNGSVSELNSSGAPLSPATGFRGGGLDDPIGITVDASGNVWTANDENNSVTQIVGAAAPTRMPLNGPASAP